ncbi:MAG TPA: FAD-dependent monooxygenase [Pseudolabrys sp.]|nr:FAD-dependent monooxygenase [Pseudolabrys sp.]
MNVVETIVVGGGPSGAAVACALATAGREVILLERSAGPHHKVCGEFLSIETRTILRQLGVDPVAHGAVPIETVRIHVGRRQMTTQLPFRALSLSRFKLDQALLARAREAGADVRTDVIVQGASRDGRWHVRLATGQILQSRHLVLATGKQGLRGLHDSRDTSLVGLKMHLRLRNDAVPARRVDLFMLDRSYAGLEMVENGIANLCLVMRRDLAQQVGPGWLALRDHLVATSPQLAACLAGAEPQFDKPLAVVCPANGHLDDEAEPEAYRVGDRLAHIPPFTGDGLAIAIASGTLAAQHIVRGLPPSVYLAAARALTARPIRLAGMMSRLAANRAGRALIIGGASLVPGLVATAVRRTRLPALPIEGRDVSYAPVRA